MNRRRLGNVRAPTTKAAEVCATGMLDESLTGAAKRAAEEPTADSLATAQLLVLAAMAAAVAGQGGYYLGPRIAVGVLLAAAAADYGRRAGHLAHFRQPVVAALALLAVWAVVSAGLAGHPVTALPTISVLAGVGVVAVIVGGASPGQRHQFAQAIVALGALTALSGWVGVALRVSRWASPESGLWRATTSVTYTNAAAAVMAALALLALAMLVGRPSLAGRAAAMMLILGVVATLSRAGIIGLALGYCLLAGLLGVRRVAGATVGTILGAAIAAAALMPSMPVSSTSRPGLVAVGLLLGLGVALAPPLTSRRATSLAVFTLALVPAGVLIGVQTMSAGWSERISISSSSRGQEARAAIRLVRDHPVAGVGPGRAAFLWAAADRHLRFDRYAHDEYLQVAAEDGLVGAALLLVLLGAVARTVLAGRRPSRGTDDPNRWMWAGAAAGLIYLAGHSGFDFLWHVPIVTLVAAALVGICISPPLDRTNLNQPLEAG